MARENMIDETEHQAELVIVGGGTAALAAADEALALGVESLIIIDKGAQLGGECALNACVPTKTMLTASRYLLHIKQRFVPYGIEDIEYRFHFGRLMQTVDEVIQDGDYDFLKDDRVTVIQGEARFSGKNTLDVLTENETLKVFGDMIMVATGATPVIPNIVGLNDVGYITFQQATHLKELPASLAILGGGPVGVEFAQLFQTFGVQVTLLQQGERLLEKEDIDISNAVYQHLSSLGIKILLNVDIEHIKCGAKSSSESGCHLKKLEIQYETSAHTQSNPQTCDETIEVEEILLAIGMKPNIANLQLSNAGIKTTKKNSILVDRTLQTTNTQVWAIGDVIGEYQFTHVADYHAVIAVRNALNKEHKTIDYDGLGWAIYTEPTIARVGLTEAEAKNQFPSSIAVTISTADVSRYRIEGERNGFIKLVVDSRSRQILGAHFFASHAEDMAHVIMLAIRQRLTIEELVDMCYIYPSKPQLIQKALEKILSQELASKSHSRKHLKKHLAHVG